MSKHLVTASIFVLLVAVSGHADAARGVVGKWKAQSMTRKGKTQPMPKGLTVTIEFRKGGSFIGTMVAKTPKGPREKVDKGTWKVKGNTLTTTGGSADKKKTEEMKFKVKGRTLTLTKPKRGETLILKRIK